MNAKLAPLMDELRGGWRFRWAAFATAAAVALAGWLIVFALPDRYEAQAAILVDTHTALKPALEGLAVDQDINVQLDYVSQALLASPELTALAERVGVIPATGIGPAKRQELLKKLRKRINLTVDLSDSDGVRGSATYGITYQDVNRAHALEMVRALTSTLINETLGGTRQGSLHAQEFLKKQIADYEDRLQTAEDRLAAFRSQHLGVMPAEQGGYFAQLEQESVTTEDIKTKLIVAKSRRDELSKELHGSAAVSAMDSTPIIGPNGQMVAGDTVSQIQQVQAHLDQLLLKFTDKYPDVIAARKTLAELKKRRAQEIAALERGDASVAAMSGAGANPVYQSIELALNKADVDIADLKTELAEHQSKAQQLRHLLNATPELQAQYAQLSRDYDINKKQYAALLASYDKARLGEQAGNAGAVRFALVQPPLVSFAPVWPARGICLAGVLLFALAAGGGLAYSLNRYRPVVGSPAALRELTGIEVITVVGCAFPTRAAQLRRREVRWLSLALACLLVGFVLAVALSHAGVRLGGRTPAAWVHA
ncbi:MAG: XrtA system polysaccharide chain length determinant [Steroidobacteraceae bacterium]